MKSHAKMPKFELGQTVSTPGALEVLREANMTGLELLGRHVTGDWGDMDPADLQANDFALEHGSRIFSAYVLPTGAKMWVITEADRSATTFLLPEEY